MEIIKEINRMQRVLGHSEIEKLDPNWKIFYEEENDQAKGFVILYTYNRLPYEPEYMTGKVAEIGIFTFPEHRGKGVATRLVEQAIEYAKENRIDIVADCKAKGYTLLKQLGFIDSIDKRVWLQCSK